MALRTAEATLVRHHGLHQVQPVAGGTEHLIGALRDTQLTTRASFLHIAEGERTGRYKGRLALGCSLILYLCQSSVHHLVLLLCQGGSSQKGRGEQEGAARKTFSVMGLIGLIGLMGLMGLMGLVGQSVVLAGVDAVATSDAAAGIDGVRLIVDAGTLAIPTAQRTALAFLGIEAYLQQREPAQEGKNGAYGTNGVAIGSSVAPCQYAQDDQHDCADDERW